MRDHEVDRIPENSSSPLELDGIKVLLCNSRGTHYAIANNCTHQDTPLEKGRIRNGYVSCPLHGVRFNLETGEPMGELTRTAVQPYPVTEAGEKVIISMG